MQKQGFDDERFSVNLRYLLWRNGISRDDWSLTIQGWLACSALRSRKLLGGAVPSQAEGDALSERLGATIEDLRFGNLLDELGGDVFAENLRSLVSGLKHGQKGKIARELGIHATSLSRWIGGTHRPDKRYQESLAKYFGLPSATVLNREPLFLSQLPVSADERRRWLHSAIDELDRRDLDGLFPALFKLLA